MFLPIHCYKLSTTFSTRKFYRLTLHSHWCDIHDPDRVHLRCGFCIRFWDLTAKESNQRKLSNPVMAIEELDYARIDLSRCLHEEISLRCDSIKVKLRVEEYWVPSLKKHSRRMHKIHVWKYRISVGVKDNRDGEPSIPFRHPPNHSEHNVDRRVHQTLCKSADALV